MNSSGAISFRDVSVTAAGKYLLKEISLEIPHGARLVVIGKNGAGKTTLFNLFSATSRPSGGAAFLLGEQLGHCDMRKLRQRIGIGGSATLERLNQAMTVTEAVLSGIGQVLSPWWLKPTAEDILRAANLLEAVGLEPWAERSISSLSMGERQQVGIARALITDPEILLLDEPTAGLDLGAREAFVARIAALCSARPTMTVAIVTHHVEEIPPSFEWIVGLKEGKIAVSGPIDEKLTSKVLSGLFDVEVTLSRIGSRFVAFGKSD